MESPFTIDPLGPFTINQGDDITLDLNLNFIPMSITWSADPSLSCTDCEVVVAAPLDDIVYAVTIIDASGCELSTEISVTVEELIVADPPSDNIYTPNVFSPSIQGSTNAVFRPLFSVDTDIVVTSFTIFDRYGNIVHEELDGAIDGWNGFINDVSAEIGVYVYKLNYIVNDRENIQAGSFTLLR
jgi:gliding motility-associated-like protein